MTATDLGRRLAAWSRAVADAVPSGLDDAAATAAAEARRRLGPTAAGVVVVTGRDAEGHAALTVTMPDAMAREFGTRRTAARPVLRPAIAATRDGMRRLVADAVRRALARGDGS